MPRLVFDQDVDRVVEMGVSEGILSVLTAQGYDAPVAWNGLTSVANSPEGGETEDIYADNMVYATTTSTEKFGGTIECYTYPDAFAKCDGSVSYAAEGSAKFGGSFNMQKRSKFGFAYKTNANDAAGNEFQKLHIIWNAQANPTERTYETVNDSPEAITFSYEFSCVGVKPTKTFNGETLKATSHFEIPSKVQVNAVWTTNPVYTVIEEKLYGKGAETSDPDGVFPDINTLIGWIDDAMKPADSSAE